jgi:hypothetical protein
MSATSATSAMSGGEDSKLTFADYKCQWNTPISATYHDYKLWTVPAPASGAIWLSAMGTLSHFPPAGAGTVLDYHRVTEALRVGRRPKQRYPAGIVIADPHSSHMVRGRSSVIPISSRDSRPSRPLGSPRKARESAQRCFRMIRRSHRIITSPRGTLLSVVCAPCKLM